MFSKISSIVLEYSIKALGSFKFLIPAFCFYQSKIGIWVLLNLWHINEFCR